VVLRIDGRLRVFADLDRASEALALELARRATSAVRARGRFRCVISGGKTPLPLFARLAKEFRTRWPWGDTEVFFADERCVPPDDPRSNFGAAWGALLSRVPIPRNRVHRMPGEMRPHSEAARRYARLLGPLPDASRSEPPLFDAVLLGIGPDGHTASLFPGQPAVDERTRTVVSIPRGGLPPPVARITMTPPALSSTRFAVFLVSGADKAPALSHLLRAGERGDHRWPASRVRPTTPCEWYLDRAAAAGIPATVGARR
jgi:6-phosphogluconolactonase